MLNPDFQCHWNCCQALCTNNYSSRPQVKAYRVPPDIQIQRKYASALKTDGVNWCKAYVCSSHWSGGKRLSHDHIPDTAIPDSVINNLELRLAKTSRTDRKRNIEEKICHANKLRTGSVSARTPPVSARTPPTDRSGRPTVTPVKCKTRLEKKLNKDHEDMKQKLIEVQQQLQEKVMEHHEILQKYVSSIAVDTSTCTQDDVCEVVDKPDLEPPKLSYEGLSRNGDKFSAMTGLFVNEFCSLYKVLEPFFGAIKYPGCAKSLSSHKLSKKNELMCVLIAWRQAIKQNVVSYLFGVSEKTVSRVIEAWTLFIPAVLDQIDLCPSKDFIISQMPMVFKGAGFGDTSLILDCTEFKHENFSDYQLNGMNFSDYKNAATCKSLVGITAYGSGVFISNCYPGSITDSDLTQEVEHELMKPVYEGSTVLTDKGFNIFDICVKRGATVNKPPVNSKEQFDPSDCQQNFDIASLRIHVERFIGQVRCWEILNQKWPIIKLDLLSYTWRGICLIFMLLRKPVGPKA